MSADVPTVIAMFKAPRPGFVKTRLARELGDEKAAAIYRALVERQVAAIPREWRFEVHHAPADAQEEMRRWLGLRATYHAQSERDLGERLVHAFAGAFRRGAKRVIAIGGDCPTLNEHCLREAADALGIMDVVLGPASDGGYYLIGLRRAAPELFRRVSWGSSTVFEETLQRMQAAGLSHQLLAEKEDVDDLAAWRRAGLASFPTL